VTITVTFTGSSYGDLHRQINNFAMEYQREIADKYGELTTAQRGFDLTPEVTSGNVSGLLSKDVEVTQPSTVKAEKIIEDTAPKADAPIPYETVRDAVLRLALAKGKPRVMELLNEFGAQKKADEIDPARYAEVLETINKIMEA
jgi:hypothetical protein